MRIPVLPRPKEIPSRSADKGPDDDHAHPEDMESEKEGQDLIFSLFEGVITVPFGIDVDKGDHHKAHDDETGQDYARMPRVEINQHLLETEEVPWGLRRVGRTGGVSRLFER